MKKILSILLIFILIFAVSACGGNKKACSEHEYIKYVVEKPTCQAEGLAEYCCSICEDTYTEKLDKVDHDFAPANCASPERCTMCNLKQGKAYGHNFQGSGCNNCNTYEGTKLAIPTLPFTLSNSDGSVKVEVSDMKYILFNDNVYITFVGKKTYDSENGGKNPLKIDITLKNTITNQVHSTKSIEIKDLAVGDTFSDFEFIMDGIDYKFSDYAIAY